MQVGSLTPYVSDATGTTDHYEYQDPSGAVYRLDQNNNGVWSGKQSLYVWFDSNSNILHFRDGSFWQMGCIATAAERDAGTYYPTVIEDSNGNQISITYGWGVGSLWPNTSSRITSIGDARGASVYTFSYTGPYLTGIANSINSGESFTLAYSQPITLTSPFSSSANFGTVQELASITNNATGLTTTFTYDPPSGELTKATFPYGGYIRWEYENRVYAQSTVRAVQNRYLLWDNVVGERTFSLFWTNDPANAVASATQVVDSNSESAKNWIFSTAGDYTERLPITYKEQTSSGVALCQINYFWSVDATGNPYIGRTQDISDPGQSYSVTKQTDQTIDQYGSVTETMLYSYDNLSAPAKMYTNTYLGRDASSSDYASRYIFNRLMSSSVSNGTITLPLVVNSFDEAPPVDAVGVTQHDANYGTAFTKRGNVTSSFSLGITHRFTYDITGTVTLTSDGNPNHSVAITTGQSTNYSAPPAITTANSLTTTIDWSPFLAPLSNIGPNGNTSSTSYDSNSARPTTVTSPYGAITSYTYSNVGPQIVATINGRWTKTYLDGLGRTVKVERGDQSGVKSVVDTVYDTCGCNPIGKSYRTSMPHTVNTPPVWRQNTYDALGRTLTTVSPDGASTISYSYQGNKTTVADASGKWKTYTMDAFGELIQVKEPAPTSSEPDHVTLYSYDLLGHLTLTAMTRTIGGQAVTQTRAWTYDPATQLLTSKTLPETGTTAYAYNADGTLATITDAKNQRKVYSYDAYGRLTQIARGNMVGDSFIELTTQRITLAYDGTNGGFSQNTLGRLSTISYTGPHGMSINEYYSYHPAGAVTAKDLQVSGLWGVAGAHLIANYGYDNEGRVTAIQYPVSQWNAPNSIVAGSGYNYGYDSMGRLSTMTDQNNSTLVSAATYGPANELLQMNTSTFSETRSYNVNLQLTELISGATVHVKYNYSPTQNNGRMLSQTDVLSGETITYQYDTLNRLIQAAGNGDSSGAWSQTFSYDGFGNLTQKTASNAPAVSIAVDPLTNRVQAGAAYDANGNLTALSGATYLYDIENRVSQANPASGGTVIYGYDTSNERIYKGDLTGSTYSDEELYFYGIDGRKYMAWKINPSSGVYLQAIAVKQWFGGRLLAPEDQLGSQGKYFPYGEDRISPTPPDPLGDTEKVATYTRDSATGMDYAYQRYYIPGFGRFMTSDPSTANIDYRNPTSWNMYSYVNNDPANGSDATGMIAWLLPDVLPDERDPGVGFTPGCLDPDYLFGINLGICGGPVIPRPDVPPQTDVPPKPIPCKSLHPVTSDPEMNALEVLFGEDSWYLGYDRSDVFLEDTYMLAVMYNLATYNGNIPGSPTTVSDGIYEGRYKGYPDGRKTLPIALASPASSDQCLHVFTAETAYAEFWTDGPQTAYRLHVNQWRSTTSHTLAPGNTQINQNVFWWDAGVYPSYPAKPPSTVPSRTGGVPRRGGPRIRVPARL